MPLLLGSGPETAAAGAGATVLRIHRLPAGTGTAAPSSPAGATGRVGIESPWTASAAVAAGRGSGGRIVGSGSGAGGTGGPQVPGTASGGTAGGCSRRRGSGEAGRMPSRGCGRLGTGGSRTGAAEAGAGRAGVGAAKGMGECGRGWWAVEGEGRSWRSWRRSAMS